MVQILKADVSHLTEIAPLFDAYRQFYDQPADLAKASNYIGDRLMNEESVIFLAKDETGKAVGFTQLYPTFCSVAASNVWVLYDLFVSPEARRTGVAEKLMQAAKEMGIKTKSAWLKLETGVDNTPGQALYEKRGWHRDTDFYTYFLDLED